MATGNSFLFEKMSIKKAVLTLAVPTVISQLITVIYNMADTFYIGQMNDPNQVAAATVAMPLFMMFNALSNFFGIGGSSLVARSLGENNSDRARKTASFCVFAATAISVIYGISIMSLRAVLLPLLGADKAVYGYAYTYVFWTVTIGTLPSVMNPLLAHLIRAEGYSKQASFGVAMGGVLNILLDPLFIFTFKMEIKGAAVATLISNVVATLYFVFFIFKKRKVSVVFPRIKDFSFGGGIPFEVAAVGLPSFAISFMASISNSVLNSMVASYSTFAIAGMGIAKKINLIAFAVAQGMTQGSLPLIGFNYTAKNKKRMDEAIKTTFMFSIIVALIATVILFFGANFVTKLFIDNVDTVGYATRFLKIICLACPGTTISLMTITVFQATGKKIYPIILSLLRKGGLDVPFMILFNIFFKINGIAWATPIADTLAAAVAVVMLITVAKKGGLKNTN